MIRTLWMAAVAAIATWSGVTLAADAGLPVWLRFAAPFVAGGVTTQALYRLLDVSNKISDRP